MTYSDSLESAIGRTRELAAGTGHPEAVFALRELLAARSGEQPDAVAEHLQHAETHLELAGIALPEAEPWFQRARGTVRRTRRALVRAVERHGPELALDPDLRRVLADAEAEVTRLKRAQQPPLDNPESDRADSAARPAKVVESARSKRDRESA